MDKGLFITFEGVDGAGKTTQFNSLGNKLEILGYKIIMVREPGSTLIGEKIRKILLDGENRDFSYRAEALLYSASRAQLVEEIILPKLKKGYIVLCDRFVDSSMVYQGIGRDLGMEIIEELNNFATVGLVPDITILMDITPEVRAQRKAYHKKDRIEREENAFHYKVREGYLELAKKNRDRIKIVNGDQDKTEIETYIEKIVLEKINELRR